MKTDKVLGLPEELWTQLILPRCAPRDVATFSEASETCNTLAHETARGDWPCVAAWRTDHYGPVHAETANAWGSVFWLSLTLENGTLPTLKDAPSFGLLRQVKVAGLRRQVDLSALGRVRDVTITEAGLTDVSALANVHKLYLVRCGNVSDVSCLRNVHTLELRQCHDVTDVSALGNVHTLNLVVCDKVVDVSALGGVHSLQIMYCRGVADVSALGGVHTMLLYMCRHVEGLSALGSVSDLALDALLYDRDVDVSMFARVRSLYIKARGLSDVSALSSVHTLTFRCCSHLGNVAALANVHALTLERCYNVSDVSALVNVHTLNIVDCVRVAGLDELRAARALRG